jgi:hypothetical protein
MKNKHFYEHLIRTEEITLDLAELDLTAQERLELLSLLEANIHTCVINLVLSELNEKEKKVFLANLLADDSNRIWEHLWKNTDDLDKKIMTSVNALVREMRGDIKKLKQEKSEPV